jgi:outer membrane lipoprotein-sorting protein
MKVYKYVMTILVVFLFLCIGTINAKPLTADQVLREVDEHRLISSSFEMTIRLNTYSKNKMKDAIVMRGHVNRGKMFMINFLEPEKMKDRKILIEENDLLLIIPKVKNPIRISPAQRLVGGISYNDVAAVSYADDYTAIFSGEEAIAEVNANGEEIRTCPCLVLELTTKKTGTSYNRVKLWVERGSYLPVKAEFFALSGKKMTTVYYAEQKSVNGKMIITKMLFYDHISTDKHYLMQYEDFKVISSG